MSVQFKTLFFNCSSFVITILLFIEVTIESTHASEKINKTLYVSTNIDVVRLLPEPIISATFSPSSLMLSVKSDQSGFEDILSNLVLSTNIPNAIVTSIPYTVTLKRNSTECWDVSNMVPVQQDEFVSAYLDNQLLSLNEPVKILNFTSNIETNKSSNHVLSLSFQSFDEIVTRHQASSCSGEISVDIGVDI